MLATVSMEKVSFQRASPNKRKANSDPFWAKSKVNGMVR